mmetsp:Transcript_11110/g.29509  ORF Transcript_11110/g.29509 Transcript_11110/m.29509 type:complete len:977 (-) Transcript_11110:72-3002(-)
MPRPPAQEARIDAGATAGVTAGTPATGEAVLLRLGRASAAVAPRWSATGVGRRSRGRTMSAPRHWLLVMALVLPQGGCLATPVCGVLRPDGSVEVVSPGMSQMTYCGRLVMTNCTWLDPSSIANALCPEECPFLEMSSYSTCGSACVTGSDCGAYRPAYSMANPATRVCELCPTYGCKDCNADRCRECREGFTISESGLCIYDTDWYMFPIYKIFVGLMCASFMLAVVLFFVCGRNSEAMRRGFEHRERCLLHVGGGSSLVPLTWNVHSKDIVGVGLALYYNHLVFVGLVAAASWGILKFSDSFLSMSNWPILNCGYGTDEEMDIVVVAFARRRFLAALFLWGVLLPASIIFARAQSSAARTFDRVHTRMEDYVVALENLPPSTTDPAEIQAWVEKILQQPILGVSIGYRIDGCMDDIRRLIDEHVERCEEELVSGPRERPQRLPTRVRQGSVPLLLEGEEFQEEADGGSEASDGGVLRPAKLLASLRGSGVAFLVMRKEEDVEALFALWDQPNKLQRTSSFVSFHGGFSDLVFRRAGATMSKRFPAAISQKQREFKGREVELREVTSEPTSIVWEHIGMPCRTVATRSVVAVLAFLATVAVFNFVLFFPVTTYVMNFSRKAGQAPTSWQTLGLGLFMGAGNSAISNAIFLGVPRLGFRRKDQADIVTFVLRYVFVISNTLALVLLTARKLAAVSRPEEGIIVAGGEALERSEELGMEVALAEAVYRLFAGTFISGVVSTWAMYPGTWFQAVLLIKTGLAGSKLSARECEKLLEPMEIWLPWDYASHVQLPCCAFFPLFLAEPPGICSARSLCAVLLLWCVVTYCAQRFVHLRASKETFFTTARLDVAVLYAWGIPLAQLALTAAYWAVRASGARMTRGFTWGLAEVFPCIAAYLGTCCIYWLSLYFTLRHQKNISSLYATRSEPYEVALRNLGYSYFNTNPVHVLMSNLVPSMGLPRAIWYEAGKTRLQKLVVGP